MTREVVDLGCHSLSHSSPQSLISHVVSVDVKHHERKENTRASVLRSCVTREGGGPGLSFPYPFSLVRDKPYSFCGCKAP